MTEKKIDNDLNDFLNQDFSGLDESFYDIGDSDNSFYQDHPSDQTKVTIPVVSILSKSDDSYKIWIQDPSTKELMKKVFKEEDTILALKIKSNSDDSIDENIKKIFTLAQKMSLTHGNEEKEEVFYMNLNDKEIKNLEITFIDGQRTVYMDKVKDDDEDKVKKIKSAFESFIVSDYKTYPTNVGNFIENLLIHYGLNVDQSLLFKTIKDSKGAVKVGKDGKPLLDYFGKYRSLAILSFEFNKVRISIPVLFMLRTASYLHTQNKYFNGKSLTSSYDKVKKSIKAKTLLNFDGMEYEDTKSIYKKSGTTESSKVPVIKAESTIKDIASKDFVNTLFKSVSLLYKMSNKTFNPSEIDNQAYKSNLSYILFGKVKCKYENDMFLDGNNKTDFLKLTNQGFNTPTTAITDSNIVDISADKVTDFNMDDI